MSALLALARPDPAAADAALVALLDRLAASNYAFVSPTPATRSLVAGRRSRACSGRLTDVLGWSLPFGAGDLPAEVEALLRQGGVLESTGDLQRATVRVSTVDGRLHLHSAPGADVDAVFLGPDSYRFVRFLDEELRRRPAFGRAVDIGTGAGVGALALAARNRDAEVIGTDINPLALRFMRINAAHAGLPVTAAEGRGLAGQPGPFDLVVANPPYIADDAGRTYRDGGGDLGTRLAVDWVREAADRLAPGGRIVLYTGAPVVDGQDRVRAALSQLADQRGFTLRYDEIDPDVFGGTLRQPAYHAVDRIAAVGAVLTAP